MEGNGSSRRRPSAFKALPGKTCGNMAHRPSRNRPVPCPTTGGFPRSQARIIITKRRVAYQLKIMAHLPPITHQLRRPRPDIAALTPPHMAPATVPIPETVKAPWNEPGLAGLFSRDGTNPRLERLPGGTHGRLQARRVHRRRREQREPADHGSRLQLHAGDALAPDGPAFRGRPARGASRQAMCRDGRVWDR